MRTTVMVVLALGLSACGISRQQYAAKEAELVKYQEMYGDATAKASVLEGQLADLTAQVAATQDRLQAAESARTEAEGRASSLAISNAQRERLTTALQRQIKDGQVEISELRGRMTVKLKDRILFPPGSAALGRDGRKALDAVAEAFKDLRDRNVIVAGYTDNVPVGKQGPFKDNWDLSAARAVSVVRYLAARGVPPAMLGALGYSQHRPVAPNTSAASRSLNRRIEIELTAKDDSAPAAEVPRK